jgi:NADH-quinone oxidoreductase subunit J
MTEAVLFYLFSLIACIAGVSVVAARNPITSALSLVVCFFFLAADYVLLDADFVFVIQILVYAGAIMVLFVFVIMLLNLRDGNAGPLLDIPSRSLWGILVGGLVGVGLLATFGAVQGEMVADVPEAFGDIATVGRALFDPNGRYLLPFEVVSVLLTVAVAGAVVLAKREV